MKCKKCSAELEDGVTVCPACGEKIQKEAIKPWMLVVMITAALTLVLTSAIVIYWGVTGVDSFDEGIKSLTTIFVPRENDVYYKVSYSVSDKKADQNKNEVVATVGGQELTNGQLQVWYWMGVYDFLDNYGYYAVYYGLDYTEPLDQQFCAENDGTWQQYFLEKAITDWHNYQAMALLADSDGIKLDAVLQEDLDNLRATMTEAALEAGYSSVDALLQKDMGPGCTYDDYYAYMLSYYTGSAYFAEKYNGIEVTDAMLEAYFSEHESELEEDGVTKDSGNVADVRHILIGVDGGTENADGETVYSDEEWETCRAAAQKILDEWLEGDKTEESFAQLAEKYSEDEGSNTNGGLYENVDEDRGFVESFIDWCMDESRQTGDYGLVQTEYGYHIMYFSGSEAEWISRCRDGLRSEMAAEIIDEATEQYPLTVSYKDIVLGVIDLGE